MEEMRMTHNISKRCDIAGIISLQEEHEQHGGVRIGVITFWTIRDNLLVERQALEDIASSYNLNKKFLPSPVSLSTACTRSISATRAKLDSDMMLRWIQKSNPDSSNMTLGLVKENIDAKASDLKYQTISRITFGKTYGFSGAPHHAVVDDLNSYYDTFMKHTSQDIRKILLNMTNSCGVALRASGGVYYIPAAHQQLVDAVGKVVKSIDAANQLYQIPLFHTPKSAATLAELATQDLFDEIACLEKDVAELAASSKTRSSTLEERLRRFKEMEARVQLFASQLEFDSSSLLSRLSNLKGEVQSLNIQVLSTKMGLAGELGVI
jgi:hypothetical protein